jgi:FixJ family two-component response regulator
MINRTVYIVDDDASVREGLMLLLSVSGNQVEALDSGEALLARNPSGRGCIVLDMRMTGMIGQDVLEALAARGNTLPVIVLTGHGDIPMTVRAMKAGARDFLTKPVNAGALVARIEALFNETSAVELTHEKRDAFIAALATLTEREREVLSLTVLGLDTKKTALQLDISARTVEVHRSHIVRKVGAENFLDIYRNCTRYGISLD